MRLLAVKASAAALPLVNHDAWTSTLSLRDDSTAQAL